MRRQRGIVFIVMMIIMVLGTAAFLVSSLNSASLQIARDQSTSDALVQAKEALIGYAVTYADTHSGQVSGYLPCPDPNGIGAGATGEGSAEPPCGFKNVSAIGRLPWKTLDVPDLRDGNGECLWYAVAGTYKNAPGTDIMDWDTNGLFQILAASGINVTGSSADSQAVAVVFSPGMALQGQNRAPDGSAPICGGNYAAGNYLDSDATIGANNSLSHLPPANGISKFFTAGATARINDQIIYITKSDIFNAIRKRNDFGTFVSALLSTAGVCLSALPAPITIDFTAPNLVESAGVPVGSLITGRIPYLACSDNLVRKWRDNLLYAACTSGNCLKMPSGADCKAIVVFTGDRMPAQARITNADRNDPGNYLEGAVLGTFKTAGATHITSASVLYDPVAPSTDVVTCIP